MTTIFNFPDLSVLLYVSTVGILYGYSLSGSGLLYLFILKPLKTLQPYTLTFLFLLYYFLHCMFMLDMAALQFVGHSISVLSLTLINVKFILR